MVHFMKIKMEEIRVKFNCNALLPSFNLESSGKFVDEFMRLLELKSNYTLIAVVPEINEVATGLNVAILYTDNVFEKHRKCLIDTLDTDILAQRLDLICQKQSTQALIDFINDYFSKRKDDACL